MSTAYRLVISIVVLFVAASAASAGRGADQLPGLNSGVTLGKALILSDSDVLETANDACARMDQMNPLAPSASPHAARLARLTSNLQREDGLSLTFRVYMVDELNAWAMANGCVRVYSGLLDAFTDDEVRGVIGHEIGHVKLGHTKAKMRTALLARGARQGAVASG
jgi:putative metalloprotease